MAYTSIPPSTGGGGGGSGGTGGTYDLATATGGIIIDGTGEPTLVPLLIKNGKNISGIDLQATGAAPTGVRFLNAAGAQKGAMGVAVAAGEWTLGSLAGDFVITGSATATAERIFIRTGPAAADSSIIIASSGYGNPGQIIMTAGNASLNLTNSGGSILGYGSCTLTMATAAATFAAAVPVVLSGGGTGSAASAGNLDLQSTTHATKGLIRLGGATGLVYDETAKLLGIGKAPAAGNVIDAVLAAGSSLVVTTAAAATLTNGSTSGAASVSVLGSGGGGVTISNQGNTVAGNIMNIAAAGKSFISSLNDLVIGSPGVSAVILVGGNQGRFRVDGAGSVVAGVASGAALATTATDGFFYIAGGNGPPTGVPTAFANRYPLYWDHTNLKFYVYDAGWKGGTTPGVFI
jgi:hypothetical protein